MPARRPRGALRLPVLCLWLACAPAERTAAVPVSTGTIALEIGELESRGLAGGRGGAPGQDRAIAFPQRASGSMDRNAARS